MWIGHQPTSNAIERAFLLRLPHGNPKNRSGRELAPRSFCYIAQLSLKDPFPCQRTVSHGSHRPLPEPLAQTDGRLASSENRYASPLELASTRPGRREQNPT